MYADHTIPSAPDGRGAAVSLLPRPVRSVGLPTAAPARVVRPADALTFPAGVDTGSAGPGGATVWTRIEPSRIDGRSPLLLEIAADPHFGQVVVRRAVSSADLGALPDGAVHLDVRGLVDPGAELWFRFVHAGSSSSTGHVRPAEI